ncbi:hypothetical protein C8J57DRAFT_1620915 [Mycena rebaudengoi]|nr:hypothetical protein C8J57DRAFT_1620915 [Mycena rebaudengoi]
MKSFALLSLLVSAVFRSGDAWPNARAEESTKEIQDPDGHSDGVTPSPDRHWHQADTSMPFVLSLEMCGYEYSREPRLHLEEVGTDYYGITSFEEIIRGTGEAFNIERTMASGMAAINLLTRGNPFVNKISIGGVSPFVPPLPFKIDGPKTQGIQKHGRVEGDASISRSDVFIGDNRDFNQTLLICTYTLQVLQRLAKFGDDGPDGPATVFNLQTLIEMKRLNFESDQASNPAFALPQRRLNAAFGTTKLATKRIISSFFMNQTFPKNWFRAAAPVMGSPIAGQISAALPQWAAGHNDENGVFVADPRHRHRSTSARLLRSAFERYGGKPSALFKDIMFNGSGCTEQIAPSGPTNV